MLHLSANTPRGRIDWMKAWGYSHIIPHPTLLLLTRFIYSSAALGLMINSMVQYWVNGYWFAFMTHWVMVVNTIFLVLVSCITMWIQCKPAHAANDGLTKEMPLIVKLTWLLQTISLPSAVILTILFWTLLDAYPIDFFEIWAHGGLMIIIIIEYMINGAPYHLAHTLYPFIFGSLYTIWNGIFWAVGLLIRGYPWIYEAICWCTDDTRKPFSVDNPYNGTANPEKTAIITVSVPVIFVPAFSLFIFYIGLPIRRVALIPHEELEQKGGLVVSMGDIQQKDDVIPPASDIEQKATQNEPADLQQRGTLNVSDV